MIRAEAIRDAVLATAGVIEMHPGPYGTAATYSTSGRVWGVRIGPNRIDVHIVAAELTALDELGQAVRQAVLSVIGEDTSELMVHIEDLSPATSTSSARPAHIDEPYDEHPRRSP